MAFALALVFIFLSFMYTIVRDSQPTRKEVLDIKNGLTDTYTKGWNIPTLPAEYEWKEEKVARTNPSYRIGYSWKNSEGITDFDDLYFSGVKYSTVIVNNDPNSLPLDPLGVQISNILEVSGWKSSVDYKDISFQAIEAVGISGYVSGRIKIYNDQIRSINYGYIFRALSEPVGSGLLKCPCEIHLSIFISDPVNLSEIPQLLHEL